MDRARWLSSSQVSSWFGDGNVQVPSRPIVGKLLTRDANYEGVVHWLGTNFGTQAFTNPYGSKISFTISSDYGSTSTFATDRNFSTTAHSTNTANSWMNIDIANDINGRRIVLTEVCMKQRTDYNGHFFQQFYIDGSVDNSSWTRLATITSGVNIGLGLWTNTLISSGTPWRYVRITMTGTDSGGYQYFTLGELELFGTVQ